MSTLSRSLVLVGSALLLGLAAAGSPAATALDRGAVAAPEAQAAQVGGHILRRGGNAVDAAIAVQFAIAVTNAIGTGIGGGGFMLIHDPERDEVVALDYRETAPAGAHRDMFLDDAGEVDAQLSIHSALASGVPGTVRGMAALHERFGTLPWTELLEPAIDLSDSRTPVEEAQPKIDDPRVLLAEEDVSLPGGFELDG